MLAKNPDYVFIEETEDTFLTRTLKHLQRARDKIADFDSWGIGDLVDYAYDDENCSRPRFCALGAIGITGGRSLAMLERGNSFERSPAARRLARAIAGDDFICDSVFETVSEFNDRDRTKAHHRRVIRAFDDAIEITKREIRKNV